MAQTVITLDIRKSIGFMLGDRKEHDPEERNRRLLGTAFFVDHYVDQERNTFLVTARHLLNMRQNVLNDDQARYLWINNHAGHQFEINLPDREDWIQSPTADVAVTRITPPPNWDGYCNGSTSLLSRENALTLEIGEGTEVFFAGLFSGYTGENRIEPVCRFGHISLMPRNGPDYLVEALSHGGVSGSPAFIIYQSRSGMPQLALIGLVSRHYEIPAVVRNIFEESAEDLSVNLNSGIAGIVPGCAIISTIQSALQE